MNGMTHLNQDGTTDTELLPSGMNPISNTSSINEHTNKSPLLS